MVIILIMLRLDKFYIAVQKYNIKNRENEDNMGSRLPKFATA